MRSKIFLLTVLILCVSVNLCYAREIVEKIDFASYGENTIPSDWIVKTSGGNVFVKEKNVSGKKIKTLLLSDNNQTGENGVTAMKMFDELKGKAGFEIKFMTRDLHNSERAVNNIVTEYERNFTSQGINIKMLEATPIK